MNISLQMRFRLTTKYFSYVYLHQTYLNHDYETHKFSLYKKKNVALSLDIIATSYIIFNTFNLTLRIQKAIPIIKNCQYDQLSDI
jgi:hypothetical protein